jgi:hypothetical protein
LALSIDELVALEDRPVQTVHVKDWNADVMVRVMEGPERDSLFAMQAKGREPSSLDLRKAILLRGLCDADGNRLSPEVIAKIASKSGNALEQLMHEISELNALSEESRKKLLGKPETS